MLPTDNYLWANCPGVIVRWGVIRVGNCPGGSFPGWELSGVGIIWVGIVRGGNYLGGNCPGGTRPGGSCLGGNCPGGTCPGGSCPVTVSWYSRRFLDQQEPSHRLFWAQLNTKPTKEGAFSPRLISQLRKSKTSEIWGLSARPWFKMFIMRMLHGISSSMVVHELHVNSLTHYAACRCDVWNVTS